MKSNRPGRWSGAMVLALLLAGGKAMGQASAPPADPCEAPIPPEMGADYDDNCWAYTPNSSGDMFTPLWEKNIKVDCPVLGWKTGEVADVVFCAKVGTSKTKTVSRSGGPDLKPGVIHCIFEAEDGYDCGNSDHPCAIDPATLSTAWKIETDHEVTAKSGTGTEAQFAVTVPEDATGPIRFEVAFTVAANGGYSDLLKAKGCTLDVEAGKVPVTVHPVRLVIKTDPETPWAGDVVTYSLGAGSLLPPDMEVTWTAPNNNYECESDSTKPPTAGGGQFRLPFHENGSHEISAMVCDVTQKETVSAMCYDCEAEYEQWKLSHEARVFWLARLQSLKSDYNALMQGKEMWYKVLGMKIIVGMGGACDFVEPETLGNVILILLQIGDRINPPHLDNDEVAKKIDKINEAIREKMIKIDEALGQHNIAVEKENRNAKALEYSIGYLPFRALCEGTLDILGDLGWSPGIKSFCDHAKVDIPPVYPAEIVKCPPVVWGTPISN